MWRALSLLVVLMLGVGVYALVTGGATASPDPATTPGSAPFGFALAAGAVAMFAALFLTRPRLRFRR